MALSHVSLTGNPAAAWNYFTRSSTLGSSYALNACRVDLVAVQGMLGRFSLSGFRAIRHSLGPDVSRHPDKIGCCWALYTTTASLVITTLQSASQILPIPRRVCLNDGITWPFVGKLAGREGRLSSDVPVDSCTFPVAVPTLTFGADGSKLQITASFAK